MAINEGEAHSSSSHQSLESRGVPGEVVSRSLQEKHLRWQRGVAFLFLAFILAALLGARFSPVAAALERGERMPVLLFGVDAADLSRHTDTLMLGVLDPGKNYFSVLSIPRDTRINLPGYRFNRVNEIFGYTLRKTKDMDAAAAKVLEGVTYLLSGDGIAPVLPYYVQVDFSGFRRLIDVLGGVWVEVKQPMHYDDNAGRLHIHFEPGRYLMRGDDALRYVRFRGPTGDRGRIYRQQEFIRGFLRAAANPLMLVRLPQIAAVLNSTVRSNMSFWDFVYLISASRRLRADDIGFYILPGKVSGVYWSPKKDMVQQLSALLFHGKPPTLAGFEIISPQVDRVTIKVWNASGKSGFGYGTTKFLRNCGYDVIDWGNYAVQQLQTRVIDRTGTIENAQLVAASLGVENYHSEPNPKALVDVEVVIGQNYVPFFNEKN